MPYKPLFEITLEIFGLAQQISKKLGKLVGAHGAPVPVKLRRENRIKTIQASLEIEGNTLGVDQISALLEGRRVMGPKSDLLEVQNAIALYSRIHKIDPLSLKQFLAAHHQLMSELAADHGCFRSGGVGICKGDVVLHMAPPAGRVLPLMKDLFEFLREDLETPWILKAAVFHYELEFIHPFSDGNGRMGRLWQQLLLMKEDPLFQFIPVETVIRDNQAAYYEVLRRCDQAGSSTLFIAFCLEQILKAVTIFEGSTLTTKADPQGRLLYAEPQFSGDWFARKEYLLIHKSIASATASRDLAFGVKKKVLEKKGDGNQARYRFLTKKES